METLTAYMYIYRNSYSLHTYIWKFLHPKYMYIETLTAYIPAVARGDAAETTLVKRI